MPEEHIRQTGLDPDNPKIKQAVTLASELIKFPRHLSQHVGGYVLTKHRLDETVPIGNAAMPDRTFIEWDKDDIDSLGLMKVDVLALGMLTAIRRALFMLDHAHNEPIEDIAQILQKDGREKEKGVYAMLQKADSIGVFQVESRAQMSMLPRLRPKEFYDLVIQVAIVRPGPIQGNMVHPYLRRREEEREGKIVQYPRPHPDHGPADELELVLKKTLGVPLFQEQAMQIAIVAAEFSPDDANGLRRSMATFRNMGDVGKYYDQFVGGMIQRGYDPEFAERCFKQIEGFGSYGFPESHAISFGLLVYVSAWIKWKYPDVFCAALLNSQPMGFYQPSQLVRDAREHGVEVRPVDILASDWDCTLESPSDGGRLKAVRLGLRQITGLSSRDGDAIEAARHLGARTLSDIARKARLSRAALEKLAEADALRSVGLDRREGLWAVKGLGADINAAPAPLHQTLDLFEPHVSLPAMPLPVHVAEDFRTTSLSLKAHPLSFYRKRLDAMGCTRSADLKGIRDGKRLSVAGLVLIRQRPGSAKGVMFMTLEDETGAANAVIWPDIFEKNRRLCMSTTFVVVHGRLQSQGDVIHIVAERFTDLSATLADMRREDKLEPKRAQEVKGRLMRSRDFH